MNKITNRVGEVNINFQGESMFILEYINYGNITVKFEKTGEIIQSKYGNFKTGKIKSHFSPTIYGVGIVGLEKTIDKNAVHIKSYMVWYDMLKRCYDENFKQKYPTYYKANCCDEWLYYKNFKDWYNENYYEVDEENMQLDKDILYKGNKIYSPKTCIFVPQEINLLFVKNNINRGKYPIGVRKNGNRYQASGYSGTGKSIILGTYDTSEQAFYQGYKPFKEKYIKQVADEYKDKIPKKLYDAMYNWKVDIDD